MSAISKEHNCKRGKLSSAFVIGERTRHWRRGAREMMEPRGISIKLLGIVLILFVALSFTGQLVPWHTTYPDVGPHTILRFKVIHQVLLPMLLLGVIGGYVGAYLRDTYERHNHDGRHRQPG